MSKTTQMRNPTHYKTRFGLYRATVRVLDESPSVSRAWWIANAQKHCAAVFPDMSEQLAKLIQDCGPQTFDDLIPGY